MTIKVYSGFSKRQNSTKQPTGGTDISVNLKMPTNMLAPVFEVSSIYETYNYVYVAAWGRYYYITDITYVTKDIVQLHCAVDTMASGKSDIGAVSAPVEFSKSSVNLLLTDPRNRPTFKYDQKDTEIIDLTASMPAWMHSPGRYICGIVCDQGLKYFIFDQSGIDRLCQALFKTSFVSAITNSFYDMKNVFVSCIWLPFVPTAGSNLIISVGSEPLEDNDGNPISAPTVSQRYYSYTSTTKDVGYPNDNVYNVDNYLDAAPYTTGTIYLPFVGVVPFDCDIFFNDKKMAVLLHVDQYTGDMIYEIHDAGGHVISTYQGNCGTQIPIAGQTTNPAGAIPGTLAALGGAAVGLMTAHPAAGAAGAAGVMTHNALAAATGVAGGVIGGASSLINSMQHHTQVNGTLSSGVGSQLDLKVYVTIRTRRPTETNIESAWHDDNGWMSHTDETISTLTGYIRCSEASVGGTLTPAEKATINSFMNSGFYYE